MHYFVTIVYNVTSENANNLLSTAIASDSVLTSPKDKNLVTTKVYFWSIY